MALEDAVTLGEALRAHGNDWALALELYQRSRVARTAFRNSASVVIERCV
jgi:salicylate hydroxylase